MEEKICLTGISVVVEEKKNIKSDVGAGVNPRVIIYELKGYIYYLLWNLHFTAKFLFFYLINILKRYVYIIILSAQSDKL